MKPKLIERLRGKHLFKVKGEFCESNLFVLQPNDSNFYNSQSPSVWFPTQSEAHKWLKGNS